MHKMPFPVPGLPTAAVVVDIHCRNTQYSQHVDQILRSLDHRQVDLLDITKKLKRTRCVSRQKSKLLIEIATDQHLDTRTKISCFLEAVVNDVPIRSLYRALCEYGNDELFLLLLCRRFSNPTVVGNVELPNNTFAYQRYQMLRRCIDNHCYNEGPRIALEHEDTEQTASFYTKKTQRLLDDLVIIKLSRVQLYGSNESDTRRELLKEMFLLCTDILDRTFLDLIYHSKMAVTAAKSGDTPGCLISIQQAMALICNCRPCFATVMALNDVMYAYQELYFINPNRNSDFRQEAVDHSRLAYHIMESSASDAVQHQWKRVNLLFKVTALLNISHEFAVGSIDDVDADCYEEAEVAVKEVDKMESEIEIRREMILMLCKARLSESSGPDLALGYAVRALHLAPEGCIRPTENRNIEAYHSRLRDLVDRQDPS